MHSLQHLSTGIKGMYQDIWLNCILKLNIVAVKNLCLIVEA